jgi:hypothetical protein
VENACPQSRGGRSGTGSKLFASQITNSEPVPLFPNLRVVAPSVAIVADMAGLVHVLKTVNQETQREPSFLDRLALVADDFAKLVYLVHDATELRIVG